MAQALAQHWASPNPDALLAQLCALLGVTPLGLLFTPSSLAPHTSSKGHLFKRVPANVICDPPSETILCHSGGKDYLHSERRDFLNCASLRHCKNGGHFQNGMKWSL